MSLTAITQALTQLNANTLNQPRTAPVLAAGAVAKSRSELLPVAVKNFPYNKGALKFPLSGRSINALIALAKPAKFGLNARTLFDRSVRSCLEISKSKITLDKQLWSAALGPVLQHLKQQLNLPETSQVTAHLHNMLIYSPGDFFKLHQDTEKLDGMMASLVVNLPSAHQGGSLEVHHGGQVKRFLSSRAAMDCFSYFAFYADCRHQIKPVTTGYRVTLTFNLVIAQPAPAVVLPECDVQPLFDAVQNYFLHPRPAPKYQRKPCPPSLIYLLDHEYTQKSLGWNTLKNSDQPRANALKAVAAQSGLIAHLVLLEIHKVFDAYEEGAGYFEYDFRGRNRSGSIKNSDNYVINDLIDENVTINFWRDAEGVRTFFGEFYPPTEDMCWTTNTDSLKPAQAEYEGYMGNYGNTLEHWYHRAAIILWPAKQDLIFLFKLDCDAAIQVLKRSALEKPATELALLLQENLPYLSAEVAKIKNPQVLFEMALKVKNVEVALSILEPLGWSGLTLGTASWLSRLHNLYGLPHCQQLLARWAADANTRHFPEPGVELAKLDKIIRKLLSLSDKNQALASAIVQWHVERYSERYEKQYSTYELPEDDAAASKHIFTLQYLLALCQLTQLTQLHGRVIKGVQGAINYFGAAPLTNLVAWAHATLAAEEFTRWGFAVLALKLQQAITKWMRENLREGDDWQIRQHSSCNCMDCHQLNNFLAAKTQRQLTWPLAKQRRQHIHNKIDGLRLPVTHITLREGSPQKMVLTKTPELFTRHAKQVAQLSEALTRLNILLA